MQWQLVVSLIGALVLIVFTFQNPSPVQMRFMGWESGHIPLPITIMLSVLAGTVGSLLLGMKRTKELKNRIRRLETELDELKRPPISPDDEER